MRGKECVCGGSRRKSVVSECNKVRGVCEWNGPYPNKCHKCKILPYFLVQSPISHSYRL